MLNIKETDPLFAINVFSKLLEVHQRTLRIYDKEGILCPKRSDGDRRLYSKEDYKKGKLILFLTRNLGVNLAGVKIILEITKNADYECCLEYIEEIAQNINFDASIQEKNIQKSLRKGRKKHKQ